MITQWVDTVDCTYHSTVTRHIAWFKGRGDFRYNCSRSGYKFGEEKWLILDFCPILQQHPLEMVVTFTPRDGIQWPAATGDKHGHIWSASKFLPCKPEMPMHYCHTTRRERPNHLRSTAHSCLMCAPGWLNRRPLTHNVGSSNVTMHKTKWVQMSDTLGNTKNRCSVVMKVTQSHAYSPDKTGGLEMKILAGKFNPFRADYCHTWHMENHPCLWRRIRCVRRIQVCMARKGLIIKK